MAAHCAATTLTKMRPYWAANAITIANSGFNQDTIETVFSLQAKTVRMVFIRGKKKERNKVYKIKEVDCAGNKVLPTADKYIVKPDSLRDRVNLIKIYLM